MYMNMLKTYEIRYNDKLDTTTFLLGTKCVVVTSPDCIHNSMQFINRIAIGYKTQYKQYHDVNNILSYIGFCIYKSHMISEKRTKFVNILNIFQDETSILIKFYKHSKMSHSLLYNFLESIRNNN